MHPTGVDRGLAVLADPTRARILRMIRDAETGRVLVGNLAETLGLAQPTVSHHMRALLDEGVVERERDGRRVWYSLSPNSSDRVLALLGDPAQPVEPDIARISDDLSARFRGILSRETVAHYVADSHRLLAEGSRSPHLASRTAAFSATRLEDLARSNERDGAERPEVLFVCVQNAGRSQLAAAILRQLAGDRVVVRTAGSAPAGEVRAAIVNALDEIGVPIGGEFPKPLTDEAVKAADVVVTMGCGDACPIYPGRRYLDWELDDPVGRTPDQVRAIRDDIDRRVRALLGELISTASFVRLP
ncbi:metalloregulator ArsR/SmtB family transcription factor [Microbacterium sp. BK668]|uniref:metalloregulator ArsR/SmtB family transcription factor n=1 Tax=Microbacterium sp. BK668 TaxID=2512118 RepID=UPI00105BDB2B|nr:metalloregulator ArsR/SmtB family transcription factor [Microbacterium sp. BK668]TDN91619.1 ArsR family transcriptional regulator [Microbacterium sp. BK668]